MSDEFEDPNLRNPDEDERESQYSWDDEFQRHIIGLLLSNKEFLLRSLNLVKPSYFTNKAHSKICSILFNFFDRYKMMPSRTIILQEIKDSLKDKKGELFYTAELSNLYDYFQPGLDSKEYLEEKIANFAKVQACKEAVRKILDLIKTKPEKGSDTWDKVHGVMRDAMLAGESNFDTGLDYFRTIEDRYERMAKEEESGERFISGWPSLDNRIKGGGWPRGCVISICAHSGVGKSVWLANLAATNVMRGKKGLYVSLEISEDEVSERLDSILSGYDIRTLTDHKDLVFNKLQSIEGVDYRKEEEIGTLLVKQFPAKGADVNTLRAYLSQLEYRDFKPDFMVVDYVGEMKKHADIQLHDSMEMLISELHGLGVEQDIFIATAMQPNRGSGEFQKRAHDHMAQEHLGGSFGQARPLTSLIFLMQNENEHSLGLGRAWVEKQRNGEAKYMIYLSFDKATLRITEIHQDTYRDAMSCRKEHVLEEVAIDKIVSAGWKPSEEKSSEKPDESDSGKKE